METAPTPPLLLVGVNPGAPVPRAKETVLRLLKLFGVQPEPEPTAPAPVRPKLVLLRGGKVDDPPPAT